MKSKPRKKRASPIVAPAKAKKKTLSGKRKRGRAPGSLLPRDNGNHAGGATPKHTPEMIAELSDAISRGLTNQQAADYVCIDVSTLEAWQKDDREFSGAIKKARAKRLLDRLRYVEGANENWQAVAWLLERSNGQQFAPPKTTARLEHTLANGLDEAAMREAEEMLGMM